MAVNQKEFRGAMLWRIDFRDQSGRRVHEWCPPDFTKTDARKLLTRRRGEVASGTYRNAKREAKDGGTVRDFAERFLADYQGRSGVRSDYYSHQVAQIVAYWKATPLAAIDRATVDRWRRVIESSKKRNGERRSSGSVRKLLVAFGTFLQAAVDWGLLDANPARDVRKPPERATPYRDLSGEEWGRVVDEVASDPDAADWELPLYRLALATASRRQEVVGLRWDQVQDGFLYFVQGKTGVHKKVPVGEVARAALAERERFRFVSPWVFATHATRPTRRHPRPPRDLATAPRQPRL